MSDQFHRSPAFQFYADDFLAGTLELSQDEVGAYIRLLCHQWNRGSIPVETEKQQRLAGGSVSVDVLAKFRLMPDGRLVNVRLEQEREKQADFRRRQREKGLASAEARKIQPNANRGSTTVQPNPQPEGQPEGNSPVSSLQSPITTPIPPRPRPAPSSPEWEGFDEFWSAYPKRAGKPQALKAWNRLKPSPELKVAILQAIQSARRSDQWTKDNGQFIPYPATYLNARRWEDEVEALAPVTKDWRQMTPEEIIRESVG